MATPRWKLNRGDVRNAWRGTKRFVEELQNRRTKLPHYGKGKPRIEEIKRENILPAWHPNASK